jgi:hypothetical protein
MKKITVSGLVVLTAAACSVYFGIRPKDWEEREYLDRAMKSELTFQVSADKSDGIWDRVQAFVKAHSSMPVTLSTDSVIQTNDPADSMAYGYVARRVPKGDGAEFFVTCLPGNDPRKKGSALQNAHILAYYALSGEIMPRLISR